MALKVKGKKSLKAATKPKAEKVVKKAYEVGDVVQFVGYETEQDEPIFKAGQTLKIVEINGEGDDTRYGCIDYNDADAYDEDSDSVDGDELTANEIKRRRGKLPSKKEEKVITVVDVGDMKKIIKRHNGDALAAARDLYDNVAKSFFFFGGMLAHLYHEQKYKIQYPGEDGWEKCCTENFGFSGRKAAYYMDIYLSFSGIPNFDVASVEKIGWTKASKLARYITNDNAQELIAKAAKTTVVELENYLKAEHETDDGVTSAGRTSRKTVRSLVYRVRFSGEQADQIETVVNSAKTQLKTDDLNKVFETILVQWGMDHLEVLKKPAVTKKLKRAA